MFDEVLAAEVRDQLRDCGLDDDSVAMQLADLKDAGMLEGPEV